MAELSVIVPYVREWPQVAFTLRSIHEELEGIDHEVIAVDNLMPNMTMDKGSTNVKGMANEWNNAGYPWLKYFHYNKKLSHWQCKNFGMQQATGSIYWFVDAHCIVPKNSASAMYKFYRKHWEEMEGSIHMPLTYHILEPRQLMYKSVVESARSDYAYTFHTFHPKQYGEVVEVPAMSTCGMMIHKKYMDMLGRWPTELGIYSGGEHFINYTMAVLGLSKSVYNTKSLCHHGDKRGYSWNHYDQQRNRAIATYMFGGERLLDVWLNKKAKLNGREKVTCRESILNNEQTHRAHIRRQQEYSIEEWTEKWKSHELMIFN